MHRATLYRHTEEGRADTRFPLARITVDDDARVEIRMLDGTILYSAKLAQLGYSLLWSHYPVTKPSNLNDVRTASA